MDNINNINNINTTEEINQDIFDKLVHLKIFRWFEPFYKKNKEMLMYLFFGVLTTAVSFVTAGFAKFILEKIGLGPASVSSISTAFSWICSVTFAYITNRIWVFNSKVKGAKAIAKEALSFYGGRASTGVFEILFMWVGNGLLHFGYWVTKICANVIVLILNYVISKLVVFRNKESN